MRRTAAILALVAVASLFHSSDVRGFALAPAGKTTGPALTATFVVDVTEGAASEGLTSIRVQKAGSSAAAVFTSGYVRFILWDFGCLAHPFLDLQASTNAKFTGLMTGLATDVATAQTLTVLLAQFGTLGKAAITDTDYAACTFMPDGRQILSFTAIIQFQP